MTAPRCLRPDLPPPSSFTVTELPHRVKLDQNEAPLDLPDSLKREITDAVAAMAWNRYPQPVHYVRAKSALADVLGVAPENVVLTVGADQTIMLAFYVAGGPGRRARWFEPTYPYIDLASFVTHTDGDAVVLGDRLDSGIAFEQLCATGAPDLAVFVAPNNPSGGMPPWGAIEQALADEGRLVFVDEAYADFAGEALGVSLLAEAVRRTNLLVGRSLSKSLLAGARLGFAVGHARIVGAAERLLTAPYHLNAWQLAVAERYADVIPHVRACAARVVAARERLTQRLAAVHGVTPLASHANFIAFRVAGGAGVASAAYDQLARAGVRVRNIGAMPRMAGCLRVTVGTDADNDTFLKALRSAVAPY